MSSCIIHGLSCFSIEKLLFLVSLIYLLESDNLVTMFFSFFWQVPDSLVYNRLPTSHALFEHTCTDCACRCQVPQHAQGPDLWNQCRQVSGPPNKNSWCYRLESYHSFPSVKKWVYLCIGGYFEGVIFFSCGVCWLHLQALLDYEGIINV